MRAFAVLLLCSLAVSPCPRVAASPRPEERPRSSLIADLTSAAVRLSQCRGASARAEALVPAVEALVTESATAASAKERGSEAAYLAGVALSLVERGISARILEEKGDDPADDQGLGRAATAATRAVESVRASTDGLPEDLKAQLAPVLDRVQRKTKSASDAVVARMKRHGTMKAAPKEERPPSNRDREEGNPYR